MHALGLGRPKIYQVAGQWFLLAANSENIKAQKNLGVLYQNGVGVRRDYVKAYMWFAIVAATQRDSEAAKHRDQIARLMVPDQIEQARKLSSEKVYTLIRCHAGSALPCRGRSGISPDTHTAPQQAVVAADVKVDSSFHTQLFTKPLNILKTIPPKRLVRNRL